jgi:uncharacterized protein (DUF58 family)
VSPRGARRFGIRLSPAGTAVTIGALALCVAAILTGYSELLVLGVTGLVLVAGSMLTTRRTSPLDLERLEVPRLVARGERARIVLRVTAKRSSPPLQLFDQLDGRAVTVNLPAMSAEQAMTVRYSIEARRRGVIALGPVFEERSDPFVLSSRAASHDLVAHLLVHPTVHDLRLPHSGLLTRELQMASLLFGADPMADFRSLREYVVGDDPRLVHWPSSAKTGTLVVRDQYEPRRASRCVVLDTLDRGIGPELFEEAVEIAASIVCDAIDNGVEIVAKTRDRDNPGRSAPIRSRNLALELFARVRRTNADDTVDLANLRLTHDPADQIMVITGSRSPVVQQLSGVRRLAHRLTVVRLDDGQSHPGRPGVRTLDVRSARDFARRARRSIA